MSNLILGVIDNYKFHQISNFIISLKKAKIKAHVCLFVGPNVSAGTISKIKKFNIEIILYNKDFPYINNPHPNNFKSLPQPIHIYNYRHFLYYDYLLKNGNEFSYTLLTDVKDVVFQKDPFESSLGEFIYVAIEKTTKTLGSCSWNTKWIKRGYGEEKFNYLKDKEIICAGTTLAPTTLMLQYINTLINEFFIVQDTFKCADQAMHNKLIHYNEIHPISKCYNFKSLVLTMEGETNYILDEEKNLIGHKGEIIPIIHQYDRHEELIQIFNKKNKPDGWLTRFFERIK